MLPLILCFFIGALLGFLASEFADRLGCSQRYRSALPKKLFIVLMSGIGAAWLYWWEVEMHMLLPPASPPYRIVYEVIGCSSISFQRYAVHLLLFTFLLAATLTDFYEMIIPDSITVVGTLAALFAVLSFPYATLPITEFGLSNGGTIIPAYKAYPMYIWSQNPIETWSFSLLAVRALWWFWCFAMLDRVWYSKLPFRKAHAIFWRYLYRSPRTKYIIAAAVIMPLVFAWIHDFDTKIALLSVLTGMAAGMILIWAIRLTSRWVLGMEAMGFGDVTLMGMIGAFLGWQAVLLIFFAAPFFGLIYGIINLLLGKGRAVPYGPFLCLATVVVVIAWSPIWSATAEFFAFGIGTIGLVLLFLLVLFAGLLRVVHKA